MYYFVVEELFKVGRFNVCVSEIPEEGCGKEKVGEVLKSKIKSEREMIVCNGTE